MIKVKDMDLAAQRQEGKVVLFCETCFMAMRFFIPFLSVPAAALLDKGKLGMMVEQASGVGC